MRKILATIQILTGLSAVISGYGLIDSNGLGIPIEWLERSPFASFTMPGLILLLLGLLFIVAGVSVWRRSSLDMEISATAGFGMQIWIFTQMYLIRQSSWLQVLYFAIGTYVLISVMLLLKHDGQNN